MRITVCTVERCNQSISRAKSGHMAKRFGWLEMAVARRRLDAFYELHSLCSRQHESERTYIFYHKIRYISNAVDESLYFSLISSCSIIFLSFSSLIDILSRDCVSGPTSASIFKSRSSIHNKQSSVLYCRPASFRTHELYYYADNDGMWPGQLQSHCDMCRVSSGLSTVALRCLISPMLRATPKCRNIFRLKSAESLACARIEKLGNNSSQPEFSEHLVVL